MKFKDYCKKYTDQGYKYLAVFFSGGGDSGCIDYYRLYKVESKDVLEEFYAENEENFISCPEFEEYDDLFYKYLNDYDWYNNEGGMGNLTINLEDFSYNVYYRIYYTESNEYEHKGQLNEK